MVFIPVQVGVFDILAQQLLVILRIAGAVDDCIGLDAIVGLEGHAVYWGGVKK